MKDAAMFPLRSVESRAAARILVEQMEKVKHAPALEVDLSFLSDDRTRELLAYLQSSPSELDEPYVLVKFRDV